MQSSVYL